MRKLSLLDRLLLRVYWRLIRSDAGIRWLRRLHGVVSTLAPARPTHVELSPGQAATMVPTEVRPSSVPGAGKGLFATAPIAAGTLIGEYCGDTVDTMLHRLRVKDWSYVATTRDPVICVDARFRPEVMVRYMNHHFDPACRNTDMIWPPERGERRYMVATRDIAAGEELFYDYGDVYWKLHRR